eukprot:TRINITY_DN89035_c0_g1_i1.p1 TRINITY_DN89035_c0_g1~~TRINITY_DN89035_c0_g1_i1.p1  ORF type:complete len:136 (-),score=2.94 TRINITY_DN89035_c0_g1_i1:116-523(-)
MEAISKLQEIIKKNSNGGKVTDIEGTYTFGKALENMIYKLCLSSNLKPAVGEEFPVKCTVRPDNMADSQGQIKPLESQKKAQQKPLKRTQSLMEKPRILSISLKIQPAHWYMELFCLQRIKNALLLVNFVSHQKM